ncbi:MAG: MSMEG_0565 family glycosyltransferase [Burkholderiales bacterium]|nr:MSMEG_0565 family glycosyltransferase [Burkholderiales bacterium]
MKIGLLTHSVNPRGGVVHTLELAAALHAAGHDVTVFAPASPGQAMFRPVPHALALVPLASTPNGLYEMVGSRIRAFEQHIGARHDLTDFDVWHAHDGIGGNALANLCGGGRIDGFVRTVHHLDHFDDARVMQWQRRSVERASRVLCVSRLWVETLRRDFDIDATLVNNGVDLARYRAEAQAGDAEVVHRLGLQTPGPLWLSVGGVEARKNALRALQAFALHRQAHTRARLAIVGGASLLDHGDYQREFHRTLQTLALGDAVVLTGAVADADMPALFRRADGLLMPSLREGFGLVVLEALASGTPVVVSRQAPFTEYLGADDAHWCDPVDVPSIAAAMASALANPPNRAAGAVPEVCRRHSWAASARRHLEVYASLTAPASASS